MSMHPRVENGRRLFQKVNTCGNDSKAVRLAKQLRGIEKHLVEHPHDVLSQRRVATIKSLMSA